MSRPESIRTRFVAVLSNTRSARGSTHIDEFIRQTARRLSALCAALSVLFLISLIMRRIAWSAGVLERTAFSDYGDVLTGFCFLSLVTVVILGRTERVTPVTLLKLGLVVELIVIFTGALLGRLYFGFGDPPIRLLTVAPAFIVFPIIVPAPTRVRASITAVGILLVASAIATATWLGMPAPETPFVFFSLLPTIGVAGIGIAVGHIVHELETDVVRARRLGSYELVAKLGGGGMGEVWRARHRMLAREAAVKLIRADQAGGSVESLVPRFEREAQTTSLLCSPHTVQLYDFGRAEDGTFYYAMELLDGLDLEDFVTRFGPMPDGRVIRILAQVCRSLEEAHRAGLIHRDIKPANIFLCRMGANDDFAKVLDFGLVKPEREEPDSKLTAQASTIGTPAYMSPEMVMLDELDGRSDIYSLGCVAYWLLTGCMLFDVDSAMKLAIAHVKEVPPPPSTRTEMEIDPALDVLVLEMLQKTPDDRPESAREVRLRLAKCQPIEPWAEADAERWWSIHGENVHSTEAPDLSHPAFEETIAS